MLERSSVNQLLNYTYTGGRSANKVDGTWSPQFLAKKGKGHAGPYTNWIWKEGCLDVLNNLNGQKKGKIEPDQLGEMLKIAQAYKKKAKKIAGSS